jgi:hypothetical protein
MDSLTSHRLAAVPEVYIKRSQQSYLGTSKRLLNFVLLLPGLLKAMCCDVYTRQRGFALCIHYMAVWSHSSC